jgi:tetratricopeptide (TPR) repeat protein
VRVNIMRVSLSSAKAAVSACLILMMVAPLPAFSATKTITSNSKTPGGYLPPMAPQMDRSIFPQQQEVARNVDDDLPSQRPYQTDPEPVDRVKRLLRDALQKHNAGDRNGAKHIFRQVLSIDPRNSDANFNLGAMAEDDGDLSTAANYYKAASLANPNDADVKDALAAVQGKIRQEQEQRAAAMQVEKKNQLRSVAQDAAAAYKAGQYDKAIALLERIDREAPGDANVKYGLGQAYRGKGDMSRARANLSAAASLDPSNSLYRNTLTEVDRQQQQQVASRQQPQSGPGGLQYDELPPGARDYGSNSMPPVANDFQQAGQITPFSNNDPTGMLYGRANDYGRGGLMSGMGMGGIGPALGMGGLAAGLGNIVNGGRTYSSAGRGTRMMRNAAMGGLSGAAVGALTSIGRGSAGMKSGAMRGALYGGLFGLLTGF